MIADRFMDFLAAGYKETPEQPVEQQMAPGQQPGDVLVAEAQRLHPRTGRPITGPTMSDITEPAMGLLNMGAATAKGAVQGFVGLPGDIEALGYGVKELLNRGADESMSSAFMRGLQDKTIAPTTEDVKKWLDTNVGTVGDGKNPYETVGEVLAPGGQYKAGKALIKGAAALAPEAGQAVIKSMEKLGTPVQMYAVPPGPKFPKVEGGIKFPEEESSNLLRLKLKREQETLQGKPMPGMPKNEREVIPAPEGSGLPDFVVGKITPDDWITRTEQVLTPQEIQQYSKWYDEVRGTFLKYTGGDQAKTDKYMRAWLVANQNIGVDGAFNNVLLQAEQFARNVPKEEMKAGGLPMATQAARNTLLDQPITEGVGFKISDFVDSAEGKTVRSIYGNDVQAGQPFVVDIHTARDTGLVDNILLNHLEKQGYAVDRDKIKVDLATGPTDTQYENRADFGRSLTDHLNSINWQGRSDWQPKEVQAVGWMAMTRLTADAATDTVTALERNLRRISMEAAPGEGSPWAKKYGKAFAALAPERQVQLTQVVTDRAMEMAKEISGIDLRTMVHGTGGWQTYQNPAAVGQALATREGSEIAANVLGYLLQQTEVWVNSIKGTTKNPKALAVDFIESGSDNLSTNDGLRSFWEKVMAADPTKLFVGYQPIRTADGDVGIRVLIDKGGAARMQSVQDALSSGGAIEKMFANLGYDVKARGYEADLVKARNDWTGKGSKNGETYLGRLADLGVRRTAADLDPLRSELEKLFERELSGTATATTTTAPATPAVAAKSVRKKVTPGQAGQSSGGIE